MAEVHAPEMDELERDDELRYQVVKRSARDLERAVGKKMGKSWAPVGGLQVVASRDGECMLFQSIVRKKKEF